MHFDAFELLNVLAGPLDSLIGLLNIINNSCISNKDVVLVVQL